MKRDLAAATDLFQRAADQGLADARYNLGNAYLTGSGVEKSMFKAHALYQSAAAQHYGPAIQLVAELDKKLPGWEQSDPRGGATAVPAATLLGKAMFSKLPLRVFRHPVERE